MIQSEKWNVLTTKGNTNFLSELKSLFKGIVLIANVLPVFTGLWLALYFTNTSFIDKLDVVIYTITGSTFVMAGALALNNWYDADIDVKMARTKNRPTVTGAISLNTVLTVGIILSILGFMILLFTSVEAIIYALVGWITYVVLYTMWSKRRYTFNTLVGSLSGAVTPLIGWAAIDSALHIVPVMLFLILFFWQMPHTYAIAMKKCDEYKAAGVAMLPVVHGFKKTERHIDFYILCLMPLPFFLTSLGGTFIVLATILNAGWLLLSISRFYIQAPLKWAHLNFIYSVNYIMILYVLMVVITFSY
ncbi:heme o synthase [Mesobacillus subterraneus]|uniref:Protoheme IX farnesyltransferase n=1 Tax=Mesobacillus subterraneus TaxID=285983 RepID=A0A427TKZ0_9BACI|nr:heme o synthase [Mesobacillus subterraneus]RSD24845.1 protoheme IX farnesyltransferase [Mesobacillus subterraneus]